MSTGTLGQRIKTLLSLIQPRRNGTSHKTFNWPMIGSNPRPYASGLPFRNRRCESEFRGDRQLYLHD
jgi:hypothetical protein